MRFVMPFLVEYYHWIEPTTEESDDGRYELSSVEFDTFKQAKRVYDKCPCCRDMPYVAIYDGNDNKVIFKEYHGYDGILIRGEVREFDYRKEKES